MKIRVLYKVTFSIFFFLSVVFPQMSSIQGGTFQMGTNAGEDDEAPVHEVVVSPYKIDRYEVSFASYDSCVKSGGCTAPHYDDGQCLMWTSSGIRKVRVPLKYRSPEYPVICVSWYQARQYCRFKGKKLPTEAQWEQAALAGYSNKYSWGNEAPDPSRCVTASKNRPLKSGSFKPNSWGLFDMTGNVWEWTRDRYERDYYKLSEKREPAGPPVGPVRAGRGWPHPGRR